MTKKFGLLGLLIVILLGGSVFSHAQARQTDPDAALRALVEHFTKADDASFAKYKAQFEKASTPAEKLKIQKQRMIPLAKTYVPQFQELAHSAEGTVVGAQALVQAMTLSTLADDDKTYWESANRLIEGYAKTPLIGEALSLFVSGPYRGEPRNRQALEKIASLSSDRLVQAQARLFALTGSLDEGIADPAQKTELKNGLLELKKSYPDINGLEKVADSAIYELEHLQIGDVAPDFEGKDQHGKPLKLSDYRGKVVWVGFWGFWCGPCVSLIPHERELVKRLHNQPFAYIGINTDSQLAVVPKRLQEAGITWPNVLDGGKDGPITTRWNIQISPSVFILDTKGVIRFRGHSNIEDAEKAVADLLKKIK